MQVGVFAKTFAGTDPDHVLPKCKAAGFSAVQYNMSCSGLDPLPACVSDDAANRVKNAATSLQIDIAAVSATYNMVHPSDAKRKTGRSGFAAIAATAKRMGTNLITVCTGSKDPTDQWRHHNENSDPATWTEMCREFEFVLDLAERHDLTVGVEPERANVVRSPRNAAKLLKDFPGSRLRIVLDPANVLEGVAVDDRYAILDEAFDLLGPAIVMAHAKDRNPNGKVVPAGRGIVDWNFFLSGLMRVGFDGPLISHGISESDAPMVAQHLTSELERM